MKNIEKETCCICLGAIRREFSVECGHVFHEHCIKFWLHLNNKCPVCNREKPLDIDATCTLRDRELEAFLVKQRAWKSFDLADVRIHALEILRDKAVALGESED